MTPSGQQVATILGRIYCATLLIGGLFWALDVPARLGWSLIAPEWLGPYLGIATAVAFLRKPYGKSAGWLEILLGLVAMASWFWMAMRYGFWLFDVEGYTWDKYLPGFVAIVAMTEAVRRMCGTAIAMLLVAMVLYGLFGFALARPLQADDVSPQMLVVYLYADTNAIPGLVLGIVASVVLAFIIFGKLMEVSGATTFFNDIATATMGHRRGGSAKIAVTASALMGSISGSPVSNIMSTGTVTIPLMKRMGFPASSAAAIEAVASTGGVMTPPIMGATAFLMAEFLQVDYSTIVMAALLPAILFYFCVFLQVDAIASRNGMARMSKADLPRVGPILRSGWIFVLPFAVLIYLLFFEGFAAQFAAVAASATLLVLALLRGRLRTRPEWADLVFDGGAMLVPLVLIGGAAGVVVGVMNISGLGQSLATILVDFGTDWGLFAMLALTALLSIILGLGMPGTAIYVVLATLIAPALVRMGVSPMGAHMFIFYYGVLSFLTPPVAVASLVAAGLAGADMWRTSWKAMQLAALAFLLPFVWVYNPGLLLEGPVMAIINAALVAAMACLLIAKTIRVVHGSPLQRAGILLLFVAAILGTVTSPAWLGDTSAWVPGVAALAAGLYFLWPDPPTASRPVTV